MAVMRMKEEETNEKTCQATAHRWFDKIKSMQREREREREKERKKERKREKRKKKKLRVTLA